MSTKVPERRLAEFQIILHGLAGGTLVILTRGPDGKLVLKKIPDPRPPGALAALLGVLAAAAGLDDKTAAQVTQALEPEVLRHVHAALGESG